MNYELFMGEALEEAKLALSRGERPVAAVAVVDDAMVVRAHDRVERLFVRRREGKITWLDTVLVHRSA